MRWNTLTRRFFLQSSGNLVLALPVLESLVPRSLAAQNVEAEKSLILFFKPNGCYPEDYFPYNLYKPSADMKVIDRGQNMREMSLLDRKSPISKILGSDFDPVRSKMNLYLGLNPKNSNHNGAIPFATDSSMPSIDQIVAKSALYNPAGTPALAIQGTRGFNIPSCFEMGGGQVRSVTHVTDAVVLYQRLFGGISPSKTQSAPNPDQAFIRLLRDKKVLDLVLDDYKQLLKNPMLSAADKKILEDYMAFMAQKQKALADSITSGSVPAKSQNIPAKPSDAVNADEISMTDTMLELMVAAIQTRICHTFHFQLACSVDESSFNFRDQGYRRGAFHQDISHNESRRGDHLIVDRHLFARAAKVFQMLDVPMSSQATYADNTLIYLSGDIGGGASPFMHTSHNSIALTLSGKNIPIQTGRALAYAPDPAVEGYPINQLLIGIMEAIGAKDWRDILKKGGVKQMNSGFGVYGGLQRSLPTELMAKALPLLLKS